MLLLFGSTLLGPNVPSDPESAVDARYAVTLVAVSSTLLAPTTGTADGPTPAVLVEQALEDPDLTRVIVAPPDVAESGVEPDVFLSEIVAAIMKQDRLDVEIAYVAPYETPATKVYGLKYGANAMAMAESGVAQSLPLIRDDAATVLVGRARHLGAEDAKLHGEAYVDSDRLFDGDVDAVEIEPILEEPGVRGRVARWLPGGWKTGRAVQTGGSNLVVEREGVVTERLVKRSTFYRHHIDWKLVGP
ncbi:hypothetical protein MP11Mi_09430 [Gordonia sp. MP11Mi]|uniref:Uncharacterized protein n=1 Tax=Gordonia sp. MP11Mi TaxID=3022769 RepID=A0AA97GVM7_9ACTN